MDDLFPFFILIDRKLTVVGLGRSNTKLEIANLGGNFFDHFVVERPLEVMSYDDIVKNRNSLFILVVKDRQIKLRGQMYHDSSNETICFLGSPLVMSFDELKDTNISLTDFAIHDNINQFLFTTQMLNASLADSKAIASKLQYANQDLRLKNEELQDMSHILSHDLKSPLRGILTLAEFMESDIELQQYKDLPFYINTIKERVIRMNNLIEGVLSFSKIGIEKTKKEWVDLNDMVRTIVADLEHTSADTDIQVSFEKPLPSILNIRILLLQLFSNLIINAVKHNDKPQTLITLDANKSENSLEISIADNGPGIDSKYHEKIFEIFQTLDSQEEIRNTGIGLSIVNKIISMLEGKIRLESTVGTGTTFYVTLPLADEKD